MRKSIKVLVCSVMFAVGLGLSGGKAQAQALTHDPLNYVQNILQYIMDQIREGNFDIGEGLSKLEGMREQFQAQRDKIDQVLAVVETYQKYSGAVSDIKAITEVYKQVTDDIMNFKNFEYLFNQMGAFQGVMAANHLIASYQKITGSFIEEVKADMFDLAKLTQSDPLTMLSQLRKETEYLYSGYLYIRTEFYSAFQDAYYEDMAMRAKMADREFFAMEIY